MKTLAFVIHSTWTALPEYASLLIFGTIVIVVGSIVRRWARRTQTR